MNIIFDEDPNKLIEIFIKSELAGFKTLGGAREKTKEMMQEFTTNHLAGSEYIHMFFESDGSVTLITNDNITLQFGKQESQSYYFSGVYIKATQECGDKNIESTISAETQKREYFNQNPSNETPDRVTIETLKSEDEVVYDVQKYMIYNDRVDLAHEVNEEVATYEQ